MNESEARLATTTTTTERRSMTTIVIDDVGREGERAGGWSVDHVSGRERMNR